MPRARDPVLLVAAALLAALTATALAGSLPWLGAPFPGFLLLENRVVASAGLHRWPAVQGGAIYQCELLRVDGQPLRDARDLRAHVAALPVGTPVVHRLRCAQGEVERVVPTRRFDATDWLLLYGSYLFLGLGLCLVALTIGFLRGRDRVATGSALSLWIVGLMAITAMDLYGPYRLFRLHALLECFMFAGTIHIMLVFPEPRRVVERRPWLLWAPYLAAAPLALANQLGLHEPPVYTVTHRAATAAFGASLVAFIASQVWAWARPRSFEARQRVKVVALGTVAALSPPVVLFLHSAASGGQAPENATAFSAILYPLSIGYALLRTDLLEVDALVRRSLNYALLTAVVVLAAAVALTGADAVIRGLDAPLARSTSILLLSLVAVTVVLPLRDRVQSVVDRVFFRSAYDFRRLVERTSARLAAVNDLQVICREIERTVGEALQPESVAFAVRAPDVPRLDPAALRPALPAALVERLARPGASDALDVEPHGLAVPFVFDDRPVALLVLGRRLSGGFYGGEDRHLLQTLANQGAVAIENALAVVKLRELNQDLEAKVRERTVELASALQELRETQRQMVHQEKMASVGQLVAGVAHEINNPLNFIEGNLYHLREYTGALARALAETAAAAERDPALAARFARIRAENDLDHVLADLGSALEGCEEGVSRATHIVRDLRSFSRLDRGAPSPVDLEEALETTLNLLRGRLTGIRVVRDYEGIGSVECLEGQLQQVFMNLLANAADAVGEAGTITVRTRRLPEERVRVEVEDDGCGIAPAELDRIFEPFFTTKEVGRGTGLGLAVSYGIVARHGGRIEVRSRLAEGTCFAVEIPARFQPVAEAPAGREGSSRGPGESMERVP